MMLRMAVLFVVVLIFDSSEQLPLFAVASLFYLQAFFIVLIQPFLIVAAILGDDQHRACSVVGVFKDSHRQQPLSLDVITNDIGEVVVGVIVVIDRREGGFVA